MANTIETIISLKDEASAEFAKVNTSISDVTASLKKMALGAVSIAAIKMYMREAIGEAVEAEEATRHLKAQMEALGLSFDENSEKIADWSEAMQQYAHLHDTTAVEALGKTIQKVGDLKTAMQLVQLAQDVAAKSGKDFNSVLSMFNMAAGGSQRGMSMMTREFGLQLRAVTNTSKAFEVLINNYAGGAAAAKGTAIAAIDATNAFNGLAQKIGDDVAPAYNGLLKTAGAVVKSLLWVERLYAGTMVIGLAVGNVVKGILEFDFDKKIDTIAPAVEVLKDSITTTADAMSDVWADATKNIEGAIVAMGGLKLPDSVKETQAMYSRIIEAAKQAEASVLGNVFATEQQKVDAVQKSADDISMITMALGASSGEDWAETASKLKNIEQQKTDAITQIRLQGSQKWKVDLINWAKTTTDINSQMVGTFTQAFDSVGNKFGDAMGSMLVDGKSFAKSMTHVWSDMSRMILSQIAAMMAKWVAFKLVVGIAGALGAGGEMMDTITKLFGMAEGGRVTRPTIALLGEGGEAETIVPDSKARNFASGVLADSGGSAITLNLGGITVNAGNNASADTIVDTLIYKLKNETVQGIKLALASANTARRNSMRAI